jgi:hypothetical protein
MTDATCTPTPAPAVTLDRETRPDRLGDLLQCLADLLVEVGEQRAAVSGSAGSASPAAQEALAQLTWLERAVKGISVEAAGIHQLLQHEQLI